MLRNFQTDISLNCKSERAEVAVTILNMSVDMREDAKCLYLLKELHTNEKLVPSLCSHGTFLRRSPFSSYEAKNEIKMMNVRKV